MKFKPQFRTGQNTETVMLSHEIGFVHSRCSAFAVNQAKLRSLVCLAHHSAQLNPKKKYVTTAKCCVIDNSKHYKDHLPVLKIGNFDRLHSLTDPIQSIIQLYHGYAEV